MRERAIALLDEHSIDEVTRELGLGTGTVSRWRRLYPVAKRRTVSPKREERSEFVIELSIRLSSPLFTRISTPVCRRFQSVNSVVP